jgi:hypothetical protein
MVKRPRIFYNGSIYRIVILDIKNGTTCNNCSLDTICEESSSQPICIEIANKFGFKVNNLIIKLDTKSTILDCDYVKSDINYKNSIPITSYENALIKLDRTSPKYLNEMPKNEQAHHKLCTICEALNIGDTEKERIYYPWWYTKELQAGVAASHSSKNLAYAYTCSGFRLCCFSIEKALHLGSKYFVELWKDYLL